MKDTFSRFHIPEMSLWNAVIVRAIEDAIGNHYAGDYGFNRDLAINWLERGGKDFRNVCEYAGLQPDYVQRIYRKKVRSICVSQ